MPTKAVADRNGRATCPAALAIKNGCREFKLLVVEERGGADTHTHTLSLSLALSPSLSVSRSLSDTLHESRIISLSLSLSLFLPPSPSPSPSPSLSDTLHESRIISQPTSSTCSKIASTTQQSQCAMQRQPFSKVACIVFSYGQCTWTLTFENVCQELPPAVRTSPVALSRISRFEYARKAP